MKKSFIEDIHTQMALALFDNKDVSNDLHFVAVACMVGVAISIYYGFKNFFTKEN